MYHLSHLASFKQQTDAGLDNLRTVVEYGTGYGGSTELLTRVLPPDATVIVLDFPIMLRVQYHYLVESGLGDRLSFPSRDSADRIQKGKVNLVPLSYTECLGSISQFQVDLFVATWPLSEASAISQESVTTSDFFGAERILYGFYFESTPLLRNSTSMSFPGCVSEYEGSRFFSKDETERYHFLRRDDTVVG